MREALSLISGVVFILGFVPYIKEILAGESKPSKSTWLIWAALDITVLVSMAAKGSLNGLIVGATVGAFIVSLLSFKYGQSGWSRMDKFCVVGAACGIVLFFFLDSPLQAIIVCSVVALIGSIPVFRSSWEDPSRESLVEWTFWWVSVVLATVAIPHWTIEDATQPLTFLTIECTMMFILLVRPRMIDVKVEEPPHREGEP